jgi:heterodisulfide reductase subunit B
VKYYTYFPGCSSSDGNSMAYGHSAQAISKVLDMELMELDDWNCCGSTPYSSIDELSSFCLSARNFSLAEKRGLDLVTPCSSCYVMMNRTRAYLRDYPQVRAKVDEALAAGGLEYNGTVNARHLLDVIVNDIGYDAIREKVEKNLEGLKVACYYGCQIVRPKLGFDHPEYPESLDKLVASLGAEPVPYPLKSQCCGGSLIISNEDVALELMKKLLDSAASSGAECIVTVCPLCQTNLDAYQSRVNKKFKTDFHIPVMFFTQLMGVAFGLGGEDLMLKTCIVPVDRALAKYL